VAPIALVLSLLATDVPAAEPRLVSERVRLGITSGQLRVHGTYRFVRGAARAPFGIIYPVIADPGQGPPEAIQVRIGGRTAPFDREAGDRIRVSLPFDTGDAPACTLEVEYVQRLGARRASYLVTTTALWQRPLERARFELELADSLGPPTASFPFERIAPGRYAFEARNFLPDHDLVVEW
jgi:hypothetical protein